LKIPPCAASVSAAQGSPEASRSGAHRAEAGAGGLIWV
jgi:hypothetical protein